MSSEHGEEQALINSARLGDEAALEALIRTHAPRLLRLAYGILGEHQGAEDAVQDALIDAWKGLSNFRGDAARATWLHTITVRTSPARCPRRTRRRRRIVDDRPPGRAAVGRPRLLGGPGRRPRAVRSTRAVTTRPDQPSRPVPHRCAARRRRGVASLSRGSHHRLPTGHREGENPAPPRGPRHRPRPPRTPRPRTRPPNPAESATQEAHRP